MKLLIQDVKEDFFTKNPNFHVIYANGKYSHCKGCFDCWTKNPTKCKMTDSLQNISKIIGEANEITIVSENYYGMYSPAIKTILDRSIGTSLPLCTYRDKQMHHFLRYKQKDLLHIICYGDITEKEKATFQLLAQRNVINEGFNNFNITFIKSTEELETLIK